MKRTGWAVMLTVGLAAGAWAQGPDVDTVLSGLRENPQDPVRLQQLKVAIGGVADREKRAQLGVLYVLGRLALGHMEEGLAVRRHLLEAYPDFPLLQELAPDRIGEPCKDCENGRVFTECQACQGSGLCPVCKGTRIQKGPGLVQPREFKCMYCPDHPGKCKECRGSKGFYGTCRACAGAGLTPSDRKAQVGYVRLLRALAPEPGKPEPVILVVTSAPPAAVAPDPAVVAREAADRAVRAAREQADGSPWLKRFGVTADELKRLAAGGEAREETLAALRARGLRHGTRGWFFLAPFPAGLRYVVAEVKKDRSGQTVVRLSSTAPTPRRGEPPVELTPRESLRLAAAELCEPLGDYLADPVIWALDGAGTLYKKDQVIESGAWVIAVNLDHGGAASVTPGYYRTAEEAIRHLGLREP